MALAGRLALQGPEAFQQVGQTGPTKTGGARVRSRRAGFPAWRPNLGLGLRSGSSEPQSSLPHPVPHCLEERPRDSFNHVPVPSPSPGPAARATSLEASWSHLNATAPVRGVSDSGRGRPSPASQVGWVNRGCSGGEAWNPSLLPAPSACTRAQGPAEV